MSGSAVSPTLLQISEWKQLRTFVIGVKIDSSASMRHVTEFLMKSHPPALQDVTVHFRVVDINLIRLRRDSDYIDPCLEFGAALCKFQRHRLSFVGSSWCHARRLLWMQKLPPLFPMLRDGNRLTVGCESSERFDQSSSTLGSTANRLLSSSSWPLRPGHFPQDFSRQQVDREWIARWHDRPLGYEWTSTPGMGGQI